MKVLKVNENADNHKIDAHHNILVHNKTTAEEAIPVIGEIAAAMTADVMDHPKTIESIITRTNLGSIYMTVRMMETIVITIEEVAKAVTPAMVAATLVTEATADMEVAIQAVTLDVAAGAIVVEEATGVIVVVIALAQASVDALLLALEVGEVIAVAQVSVDVLLLALEVGEAAAVAQVSADVVLHSQAVEETAMAQVLAAAVVSVVAQALDVVQTTDLAAELVTDAIQVLAPVDLVAAATLHFQAVDPVSVELEALTIGDFLTKLNK